MCVRDLSPGLMALTMFAQGRRRPGETSPVCSVEQSGPRRLPQVPPGRLGTRKATSISPTSPAPALSAIPRLVRQSSSQAALELTTTFTVWFWFLDYHGPERGRRYYGYREYF